MLWNFLIVSNSLQPNKMESYKIFTSVKGFLFKEGKPSFEGIITIATGIASIVGFLGIQSISDTSKTSISDSKDSVTSDIPIANNAQTNDPQKNKTYNVPVSTKSSNHVTNKPESEVAPLPLNDKFLKHGAPFTIGMIIKSKGTFDTEFASRISADLIETGIKSNAGIFKSSIISTYADMLNPYNDLIQNHNLGNYMMWYIIGEISVTDKENQINNADRTYIISFSGHLIGVSENNSGKQIKVQLTEREAGEEGIALEKAYANISAKLAQLIREKISPPA